MCITEGCVLDYIVENKAEEIEKLPFANAPGALIIDVLAAVSRGEIWRGGADVNVDSQYDSLQISELQKRAKKGLMLTGQEKCSLLLSNQYRKQELAQKRKNLMMNQKRVRTLHV